LTSIRESGPCWGTRRPTVALSTLGRTETTCQPVLFLIDGTWAGAKSILRRSQLVRALPRVCFDLAEPSAFAIKRQPRAECLCTLEAAHRCLTLLAEHGHEQMDASAGHRLLAPLRRLMEIQRGYPGRRKPPRAAVRGARPPQAVTTHFSRAVPTRPDGCER